jgi:hypothetical protein
MPIERKGFNEYKIEENIAIIYLVKRSGEVIETIIDAEDIGILIDLDYRWHARWIEPMKQYYAGTTIHNRTQEGKRFSKTMELQTAILGTEGKDIDHINHNCLDNRKSNLRITVASGNTKNRGRINSNNKTGYRNVCYHNGKYIVQLQIDGKNKLLGTFDDVNDAGAYAKEMRQKHYGEFQGE